MTSATLENLKQNFFSRPALKVFVVVLFAVASLLLSIHPKKALASSLLMSPSGGSFTVDSTFDVSLYLDTQQNSINAVDVSLKFPPDKLQLVSPTTGQSIITLWVTQPEYDNKNGSIHLQGVIPGGISANHGIITTLTFRVKSVGAATIRYTDSSKILLNDGFGTADTVSQIQNGVYQLTLPPPAGPLVTSDTHPDQTHWYNNKDVVFRWDNDPTVTAYSYVLSDDPGEVPDDISEGLRNQVSYHTVADGTHYFHIKAFRDNNWGGTTHFALHVDVAAPAKFPVDILPHNTTDHAPIFQFATTDATSGINHYELKLVPLAQGGVSGGSQPFFIEAISPYVVQEHLAIGNYDVIVRAFDEAGNFQESVGHVHIVSSQFLAANVDGLQIASQLTIPWAVLLVSGLVLLLLLGLLGWYIKRRRHHLTELHQSGQWPERVSAQLEQLKEYQSRYGTLVVFAACLLCGLVWFGPTVKAQEAVLNPPLVTTVSNNISNQEIFYIGGKSDLPDTQIVIYLQNLKNGETISESAASDSTGDWFYRHNTFLSTGDYRLWVQTKNKNESSPPSPQISLTVRPTALQFGVSRLGYGTLYGIIIGLLAVACFVLVLYIAFHAYHARRISRLYQNNVAKAEESIRRGFALVHREAQGQYKELQNVPLHIRMDDHEQRERQLLADLQQLENIIGKEIWDLEREVGSIQS